MRTFLALCAMAGLSACSRQHTLEPTSNTAARRPSLPDASTVSHGDASIRDAGGHERGDASIRDASTPDACGSGDCTVATPAPFAAQAYLKSSATAPNEAFGWDVAIDGDTLVAGAPKEDRDAVDSGAVYVFVRDGGAWSQQAYLRANQPSAGAEFGHSVAISRDTIVVGAPNERDAVIKVNGHDSLLQPGMRGAAYVFVRTGQLWTQQAHLTSNGPAVNERWGTPTADHFGTSVAISEHTIVVGAPNEESNAKGIDGDQTDLGSGNSGAAFVFVRSGSAWKRQAYLKASNAAYWNLFGASVAAAGDTIVVGAPYEASFVSGVNGDDSVKTAGGSGAAYVFVRTGEVWTQQAFLKASNPSELQDEAGGDRFGGSVAAWGDTVVVGAHCERSNARGIDGNQADRSELCTGAAYVFARSSGQWAQQAYLKASNSEGQDRFGIDVACWGNTIVVGASSESSDSSGVHGDQSNNRAIASGAAYLFARRGSAWTQRAYLKASNSHAGDQFGTAVAVANGTVVVGARFEDGLSAGVNGDKAELGATDSGAVYVFR